MSADDARDRTNASGEPAIFKCPHCRAEYEMLVSHVSFRQRSYAKCQSCWKTMYSWNSSHVPRFVPVTKTDAPAR